ncbi:MAG TPA: Flp family type IVb pilin [Symbiobacteriaceae bacterium]
MVSPWLTMGRLWLRRILSKIVRDQRGLEMIEVVLIAALVIIVCIVIWRNLGTVLVKRIAVLCEAIAENPTECATQ